ncbi:hypothetical protein CDAR_292431 [Caerostris darwini]|uniref:Uncharacterized protein n=1 Tax=Caerostris darwini TaxID=1538125 RepID=A0AAV4UD25_9ARAC|nr:hypothetical protein CDAR_292431 [Caerostris darwini]
MATILLHLFFSKKETPIFTDFKGHCHKEIKEEKGRKRLSEEKKSIPIFLSRHFLFPNVPKKGWFHICYFPPSEARRPFYGQKKRSTDHRQWPNGRRRPNMSEKPTKRSTTPAKRERNKQRYCPRGKKKSDSIAKRKGRFHICYFPPCEAQRPFYGHKKRSTDHRRWPNGRRRPNMSEKPTKQSTTPVNRERNKERNCPVKKGGFTFVIFHPVKRDVHFMVKKRGPLTTGNDQSEEGRPNMSEKPTKRSTTPVNRERNKERNCAVVRRKKCASIAK